MLGRYGRDASSLLGIEIASGCVRIAQVRRHKGRYEKMAWVQQAFGPPSAGDSLREPDRVVAALRSAHQSSGSHQRRAAVAVPASQVICKICQLPARLGSQQVEAHLLAEADRFFPFPLEDLALDFQVLGASRSAPDALDVLIAASRHSALQALQAVFEAAGLDLQVVEVDTIALRRLMPVESNAAAGLLRVEADGATLHGWQQGMLPLRREVLPDALPVGAEGSEGMPWPQRLLVVGPAQSAQATLARLGQACGVPCEPLPDPNGLVSPDGGMALACALALGGLT
ncbi:type IV pilus biogenesis protein PilM [Pseudomonas sp.]|uniref:type IV pilus biogenesis protein PilM n=1 Tax=Pseudomonas sp. TaxID=306 RepID=UPI0028AADC7F|nr:pilus assembly protein PilM [Pseudomonas sp.]